MFFSDLIYIIMIGRGSNGQINQVPIFVGFAKFVKRYPVGRSGHCSHILHQLVMANVPLPGYHTQYFLWGGDRLIVLNILWQIVLHRSLGISWILGLYPSAHE